MTKDEFFAALKDVPLTWFVDEGQLLRAYLDEAACFCPITAVAWHRQRRIRDLSLWKQSAEDLELDAEFAAQIAAAADHMLNHLFTYHGRLLEACRVTEKE